MANEELLEILRPGGKANLSGAALIRANLYKAKLTKANLHTADLRGAQLSSPFVVPPLDERCLGSSCAGLFPLRPPRLDGFPVRRRLLNPMRCAQVTRQRQAMGEAAITLRTLDVLSSGDADGSHS